MSDQIPVQNSSSTLSSGLIPIEEVVLRAKAAGVDFGKANPINRIRYYSKLGLLPEAKRKSFNGAPPSAAYSPKVVDQIIAYESQIKTGKTVQDLLREKSAEIPKNILPSKEIEPTIEKIYQPKEFFSVTAIPNYTAAPEIEKDLGRSETAGVPEAEEIQEPIPKKPLLTTRQAGYLATFALLAFIVGILGFIGSILLKYNNISQSAIKSKNLVQLTQESRQVLGSLTTNPFLTINSETEIRGLLFAKGGIQSLGANIDAGTGNVYGANLIYGINPGANITVSSGQNPTISVTGVSPTSSAYITLGNDGALTNERSLTAGTGVSISDGGANSSLTIGLTSSSLTLNSGDGLSGGGSVSLGGSLTLNLVLAASGNTGNSSASGLAVSSSGLSLLRGCADGEILKFNSGFWSCDTDLGSTTGVVTIKEDLTTYNGVTAVNFTGDDFTVTCCPGTQANITIDYTNSGITRRDENETIIGSWSFPDLRLTNTSNQLILSSGNTVTVDTGTQTGSFVVSFPTLTGADTFCLLTAANCGGNISGGGTADRIVKFTSANNIGDSNLSDDGSNINIISGDLQTGGTTRLTGAGALQNIASLAFLDSGFAGTLDVTTLTGVRNYILPDTSGTIIVDSGSGVNKVGASANADGFSLSGGTTLRNLTITASDVTIDQSLSTADSPSFLSATLSDTSNQLTLGSGNTITISSVGQTGVRTVTIPVLNANDEVCFYTLANCVGAGGGVATAGGTTDRISKFTGAQTIGDSNISDDGININIISGGLQFGGTTRVDGSGNATFTTASITTATSGFVLGSGVNATTLSSTATSARAINFPNAGGTLVIDTGSGGNKVVASSAADGFSLSGGTTSRSLTVTGSNITLTGGGNTLTLTGNATLNQDLRTTDGPSFTNLSLTNSGNQITLSSGNTLTIDSGTQTGARTASFPTLSGNDTLCFFTLANCAGAGGGVTTAGGTNNRIAKFTGSQTIGNANISDDGSNVNILSGNFQMGGTTRIDSSGNATFVTVTSTTAASGLVLGNGASATTLSSTATSARAISFPNAAGTLVIDTGSGSNKTTASANADGFSLSGGTTSRTLTVTGSNITLTGGGNTLTLTGNATLNQDLRTSDSPSFTSLTLTNSSNQLVLSSGNTLTINSGTQGAARTASVPTLSADDTFCFQSLANCAGGNVSTSGGTSGRIVKFTGAQTIADSLINETGGNIDITSGALQLSGTTRISAAGAGTFTTGTFSTAASGLVLGSGANATTLSSTATSARAISFPDTAGTLVIDTGSGSNKTTTTANADGFSIQGGTTSRSLTVTGSNITLTGGGNTLTLSGNANLNQNLRTSDSPTFSALNLSSGANQLVFNSTGVTGTLTWTPTLGNATYTIPDSGGVDDEICLYTLANCVGVGGGVTTPGGTTNRVSKFTAAQTIGDSNISDNGTVVNILSGDFQTGGTTRLTGAGALQNIASLAFLDSGFTGTLGVATLSGSRNYILPNADGTIVIDTGSGTTKTTASANADGFALSGGTTSRTLTITGSSITLTGGGNTLTLTGNTTINQNLRTSDSPTFVDLTLSGDLIVNGGNVNFGASTTIGDGGDAITLDANGTLTISDAVVTFNDGSSSAYTLNIGNLAGDTTLTLQNAGAGVANIDIEGSIVAGSGNETITLATGKIDADAITLITSGGTGSTSSVSGLEVVSNGLGLLQGCDATNNILKWNDGSNLWECATDTGATSAVVTIQEGDSTVGTNTGTLDFLGSDFNVTESPAGEDNIAIDYANSKITRTDQTHTITGAWAFANNLALNPTGTGAGNTGEIRFLELAANGTNYYGFKAPDAIGNTSDTVYTLPDVDSFPPSADMVLTFQAGNQLQWKSLAGVGAGGDITDVGDVATGAAFTQTAGNDGNSLYFEGSTANSNEIQLTAADPGSDLTVTIPAITGTLASLAGTQTFTGAKSFTNSAGLTVGEDLATNTTGIITLIGAGANNFSTVIQTATQTQNVTYTLPPDDGGNNMVLTTDGSGVLTWQSLAGVGAGGDITAVGDVTTGDAFTATGTAGTSLYFYDPDGRGQLTTANLSAARTYTLPNASGTLAVSATGPIDLSATGDVSCPTCVTSVSGTSNRITSSGGTTPVIDISGSYVGQASITTVGALASGSIATGFGTINTSNSITGTILTATTAASGLVIGTGVNATTLSSTATSARAISFPNTSGTLVIDTGSGSNKTTASANADGFSLSGGTTSRSLTVTGSNITLTGGGNTLTLTGNSTLNQNLRTTDNPTFSTLNLSASSNQLVFNSAGVTGTLTWTPTSSNAVYTIPDSAGVAQSVCLTPLNNCVGVGGGVTTAGGTANRIAKFTGSQTIANANLTDDGANVNILSGGFQMGGTTRIDSSGNATLNTLAATAASNQLTLGTGAGTTGTVSWAVSGGNKTLTIPNLTGTAVVDTGAGTNKTTAAANGDGFSLSGGTTSRTLTVTGSNITLTGGGNTLTLTGNSTLNQNLRTSDSPSFAAQTLTNSSNQLVLGSSNTLTVNSGTQSGSRVASVPVLGGNDTFCFQTLANCAGGNVSTGGGTTNRIAKFTGATSIGDSLLNETGGNIDITSGDLQLSGTTRISSTGVGTFTTGTFSTAASGLVLGSGANATTFSSTATSARAISFPDAAGTLVIDTGSGSNKTTASANADGFSLSGGTTSRSLTVTGSNITLTGGGNTLTLSGSANLNQNLRTSDSPTFSALSLSSSSNQLVFNSAGVTGTLTWTPTVGAATYTLPNSSGVDQSVCLTPLNNCVGVGGGVTTAGGTTNRVAKFTGAQTIGDSLISDNGTNINITSGNLLLSGTTRIDSSGNGTFATGSFTTVSITTAASSLAIGTGANATTLSSTATSARAISFPDAAGTLVIDTGSGTTKTTASANADGFSLSGGTTSRSLTVTGSNITLTGGGNTLTLTGSATLNQNLRTTDSPVFQVLNLSTSSNQLVLNSTGVTGTLSWTPTVGNAIYTIPDSAGANDTFCLQTLNNCTGGNVTTAGGTANRLSKFTSANNIGDSGISDNGTDVNILTANLQLGGTTRIASTGAATFTTVDASGAVTGLTFTATQATNQFVVDPSGAGNAATINAAISGGDKTFNIPNYAGTFVIDTGSGGNKVSATSQADGFDLQGGTTSRKLTLTAQDITLGNIIEPTNDGNSLMIRTTSANLDLSTVTSGNIQLASDGTINASTSGGKIEFIAGSDRVTQRNNSNLVFEVNGSLASTTTGGNFSATKSGTTITASVGTFATSDVGKFFIWDNGTIDRITAFIDSTNVTVAASGTISPAEGGRVYTSNLYVNSSGNIGIATANQIAGLDVQKGITAASGVAYGTRLQQTLTTAANNDVINSLSINPTFTNTGSFTGVTSNGINIATPTSNGTATTKNAINIGTGWDTSVQLNGASVIGATGTTTLSSTQTSGFLLTINPTSSVAYSAGATGVYLDLDTDYTAGSKPDKSFLGQGILLPGGFSNSAAGITIRGLSIAAANGLTTTAGDTTYTGLTVLTPTLTETAGNLTANGISISTSAAGAGSSLRGIDIGSASGASTDKVAINIGTGWDNIFKIGTAGAGSASIQIASYAADRTLTIPSPGANAEFCLSTGNCTGVGGAIAGSGTATQVAFFTGVGTQTITSDSNLYWDNTSKYLGIGTASPTDNLHIRHNADSGLRLQRNSNSGRSSDITFAAGTAGAGTNYWTVGIDAGNLNSQNFYIYDEVATAHRLFIDGSGDTQLGGGGIGGDVTGRLYVAGRAGVDTLRLENPNATGNNWISFLDGSATELAFWDREQLANIAGTNSKPSYSFFGDTNTGLYSSGADQIGFATGGTQRMVLSTATAADGTCDFTTPNISGCTGTLDLNISSATNNNYGFNIDYTSTGNAVTQAAARINLRDSTTATNTYGLVINKTDTAGFTTTDALLRLSNHDGCCIGTVVDAILVDSSINGAEFITDGLDASDAEILNAVNAGTNNIVFNGMQINSGPTIFTIETTGGTDALTVSNTGVVTFPGLGTTDNNNYLCKNSTNQIANCSNAGGTGGFVQLQPSSAQTPQNNANSLIWINENQASTPNLLELEVGGVDKLVVNNDGNLSIPAVSLGNTGASIVAANSNINQSVSGTHFNATVQHGYTYSTTTWTDSSVLANFNYTLNGGGIANGVGLNFGQSNTGQVIHAKRYINKTSGSGNFDAATGSSAFLFEDEADSNAGSVIRDANFFTIADCISACTAGSASQVLLNLVNNGSGSTIDLAGATRRINSTSGNLTLQTTTSGNITLTPAAGSATNISAGDLQFGGTQTITSARALTNITGYTQTSGAGSVTLSSGSTWTFNSTQTSTGNISGYVFNYTSGNSTNNNIHNPFVINMTHGSESLDTFTGVQINQLSHGFTGNLPYLLLLNNADSNSADDGLRFTGNITDAIQFSGTHTNYLNGTNLVYPATGNFVFTNNSLSTNSFVNLNSGGDFVINDVGVPFATFDDTGGITFAPGSNATTGDLLVNLDADSNFQISNSGAPTTDLVTIAFSGSNTSLADALQITLTTPSNGLANSNAALSLVLNASTDVSDTQYGILLNDTSATSASQHGIYFGTGYDADLFSFSSIDFRSAATSGNIFYFGGPPGGTATLTGANTHLIEIDYDTNYIGTTQDAIAVNVTLPGPMTVSGGAHIDHRGLVIATGGSITTGNPTGYNFTGLDITTPFMTDGGTDPTASAIEITIGGISGTGTQQGITIDGGSGSTGIFKAIEIAAIGSGAAAQTAIEVGANWDFGLVVAGGGTAAIDLTGTNDTVANGIRFDTDTRLYHSAANTLAVDSTSTNATIFRVGADNDGDVFLKDWGGFFDFGSIESAGSLAFVTDNNSTTTGTTWNWVTNGLCCAGTTVMTLSESGFLSLSNNASGASQTTTGTIWNQSFGSSTNLTGDLTGISLNLGTNVTGGSNARTGINIANITAAAGDEIGINIGTGWDYALSANADIILQNRPDTSTSAGSLTLLTQATAGQIASGGTSGIERIQSSAVYNGKLYVGTYRLNTAEVYRYDGGTTWTKVSQTTAGTIASGGTASIDAVSSMMVFDGYLYIGTTESGAAQIYRYDGGTTWTLINSTAGQFTTDGTPTTSIDGVPSMAVHNGNLYIGTDEPNATQIYRYKGSTGTNVFEQVSQTAGDIGDGDTAQDKVTAMTIASGRLYAGTDAQNGGTTSEVYRYDGGTSWTRIYTATSRDAITSMTSYNGKLYFGTLDGSGAEIFRYDGTPENPSASTLVSSATGTIDSGGTGTIAGVPSLAVYNGRLYAGTNKSNSAEIYRYESGTDWTRVSSATPGTIATSGTASIDQVSTLLAFNGSLFAGTIEPGDAEVYSYTDYEGQSFALKFRAVSDNAGVTDSTAFPNVGAISFLGEQQALNHAGNSDTGTFLFSHGIATTFGAYDLAEDYATNDSTLEAGDIVSIDQSQKGFVKKSQGSYDNNVLGVYSEKPGLRLSQKDPTIDGAAAVPIALVGRVPVKVSTENGAISAGDNLTSSSTPGVAMKATQSGQVIGRALESYSGAEIGKVMIYVNVGWGAEIEGNNSIVGGATESARVASDENGNLIASLSAVGKKFNIVNSVGTVVASISDLGEAVFSKVEALIARIQNLFIGNSITINKDAKISGTEKFNAGESEITIQTSKVKEESLIYLTPKTKTGGLNLYIKEIKAGESFTVGLEKSSDPSEASPSAATAIEFNWLIVGQE